MFAKYNTNQICVSMLFYLPRGNMDDIYNLHLPIINYKKHFLVDFDWQNLKPIHSKSNQITFDV